MPRAYVFPGLPTPPSLPLPPNSPEVPMCPYSEAHASRWLNHTQRCSRVAQDYVEDMGSGDQTWGSCV